jgi:hypothetical protein
MKSYDLQKAQQIADRLAAELLAFRREQAAIDGAARALGALEDYAAQRRAGEAS